GGERFQQLRTLLECRVVKSIHTATPVVLAGDFNDVWGTLGPRILVPAGFRGPHRPLRTFPAWAPVRALDSVYVRGDADVSSLERLRTASARAASDHLPLIAAVDVKA
ncbi:MAG TPA: endonuclease/exonuclease/phosphatase family protein, partial [Acidimicrobiia bacterium]|nr:endonuclease/exonuclease/phosphatase family protein [Acidimicrobiia bacterium]